MTANPDIIAAFKDERLQTILSNFKQPAGKLQEALDALRAVEAVEKQQRDRQEIQDLFKANPGLRERFRHGRFVVEHPLHAELYLSNTTNERTGQREWGVSDPKIFPSEKDAVRAIILKGQGVPVPLTEMKLQANVLDSDAGLQRH